MINRGTVPATGHWADAAYLSANNTWDASDALLGRFEPRSQRILNPGESYTASIEAIVPPRLAGEYRVIVRADIFDDISEGSNNQNNVGVSTEQLKIDVPLLRTNIPQADSLVAGGWRLYRLETRAAKRFRSI